MYFILGYPKSMTTWLSCFLHDSTHPCFHEKSTDFSSFSELGTWCKKNPTSGVVDTLLIKKYEQILDSITDKVILIDKNVADVMKEVDREGYSSASIEKLIPYVKSAKLDKRVNIVSYSKLQEESTIRDICSFIGIPFDEDKFSLFKECIITTNIDKFMDRESLRENNYEWLLEN